jgi:hypothetical protein
VIDHVLDGHDLAANRLSTASVNWRSCCELVAKTIIKLAQRGVHDVDMLLKTTLKEFDLD